MKTPKPSQGIKQDFERAFGVYIPADKKLQMSEVLAEMLLLLPFGCN